MITTREGRVPVVDVAVVTYNSAATIERCLAPLRDNSSIASVTVFDNASEDETVALARAAGARVIESGANLGFAAGCNRAFSQGMAEFVLFLNPDAFMSVSALHVLLEELEASQTIGACGPILVGEDGSLCLGGRRYSTIANRVLPHVPLLRKMRWADAEYSIAMGDAPSLFYVDYLWGASMLCRRDVLQRIGGFDERFFLYHEDEDLCRRLQQEGMRCAVATECRVEHIGSASSGGRTPRVTARQAYAAGVLFEKWQGPSAARRYLAFLRLALVVRMLVSRVLMRKDESAHVAEARSELTRMLVTGDPR